ncbi:MAG: rRNA small subunit methyltransferase 1, partial [Desulfovibrionaceae bacterium]|nr:rRNA small subunit methyltransferase 1 [Desulfovibrionaceae bacterium]
MKPQPAAAGKLWIVATPLGNPGDLSPRARQVLEAADFVLAEDTRRSGLLFAECGVEARGFVSFHEHNEEEQLPVIISQLEEGRNIALVSDAGFPTLSDPGFRLIRALRKKNLPVSVVPGPSAVLTALAASGIAPQPFVFLGFLPRKPGDQARLFGQYAEAGCTLVFFERKDR